jgi:deoxyadenosine/deoxycytidine kinase
VDYLRSLNEHYENWIKGYTDSKLLVIDVNNLDFVNNPTDMELIIGKVDQALADISA